ncbi:hypothetical protein K492DRAFT_8349 [Lichtheimia hyalospora FSU 10163]|nr:hypothetical protein K492DRAFT_8349 [Lichtheimia hyalospora FSU 10163]
MDSFLLQPILSTAIVLTLLPVMLATYDHHCQVPGACQDEEEYGKYKVGSKGKGMDGKKGGSFTMTLILDHSPFFFTWTPAAACEHHRQSPGSYHNEGENEEYKIGLQGKAMDEKKDGSFTMTLILVRSFFFFFKAVDEKK